MKQITEIWPIEKIKSWDKNPRDISSAGLSRLKNQIKKFGQYKPLIVNTNPKVAPVGAVAGGNMRRRALEELGYAKVWVIPYHFPTEKEMVEISLSDNDRAGFYNEAGLVSLTTSFNIDINDFSVDIKEPPCLDIIVKNYTQVSPEDDNAPPLPKKPKSKIGDLFLLGENRLLCGDATKEDDFKRLMGNDKAQMVFTDPPYNVDYKSVGALTYTSKKFRGTDEAMINDNMTDAKFTEFLTKALKNIFKFSSDSMSIYWWFASRNVEGNLSALRAAGFQPSQWIIWVKESMVLSRQDYHRCFEPCLFSWKKGKSHFSNQNIRNLRDVFKDFKNDDVALRNWLSQIFVEEFDVWFQRRDPTKTYVHPTQKPVALAERGIKKNSNPGDVVLDAFGGSGSTLIACEKLKRRGRILELDPAYCDVIVKRWEDFTGKRAIKT
jgi:DNA modification methylase